MSAQVNGIGVHTGLLGVAGVDIDNDYHYH